MNCPACGAPITLRPDTAGFACDYCHAVFHPGEEDDGVQIAAEQAEGDSGLLCPVCSVSLIDGNIGGSSILTCTQCHGILMPMNVLPGLIDTLKSQCGEAAVQTPPDRSELKRTMACPHCHKRMDTHYYAGPGNVVMDSCGECFLIWLDRGELMRIVHAPDDEAKYEVSW